MKKILKSNRGFTLANILMASAMLGGLALVVIRLSDNMHQSTMTAELKSEILTFQNQVNQVLLTRRHCDKNFFDKQVPVSGTDPKIELTELLIDDGSPAGKPLFKVGEKYGNGKIHLTGLEIKGPNDVTGDTMMVNLEVAIDKVSKAKFGSQNLVKKMPLLFYVRDDAGKKFVTKCYSAQDSAVETAKQEFCESVGGTFTDGDCTLPNGGLVSRVNGNTALAGAISGFIGRFQFAIHPDGSGKIYKRSRATYAYGAVSGWSYTGFTAAQQLGKNTSISMVNWSSFVPGVGSEGTRFDAILGNNGGCNNFREDYYMAWWANDWAGPSDTRYSGLGYKVQVSQACSI